MGDAGREQIRQERTRINGLNKDRAKKMENKIADYFGEGGKRVPMSGAAGSWKGDVVVEFQNHPGKMLVECKLSSSWKEGEDSPRIKIDFKWLPKIDIEVEITKSKFGILVFQFWYRGSKDYFVLIKTEDFALLDTKYEVEDRSIVVDILASTAVTDWRYTKGGKPLSAYSLTLKEVERMLQTFSLYRATKVNTSAGEYILLPLKDFRDLIRDL